MLSIHKGSRNWFVTQLLDLNYLVNAVNYSSLKSSSGKCDYRQTDRHQTDKHFDFLGPSVLRTGGPKTTSNLNQRLSYKMVAEISIVKTPEEAFYFTNLSHIVQNINKVAPEELFDNQRITQRDRSNLQFSQNLVNNIDDVLAMEDKFAQWWAG